MIELARVSPSHTGFGISYLRSGKWKSWTLTIQEKTALETPQLARFDHQEPVITASLTSPKGMTGSTPDSSMWLKEDVLTALSWMKSTPEWGQSHSDDQWEWKRVVFPRKRRGGQRREEERQTSVITPEECGMFKILSTALLSPANIYQNYCQQLDGCWQMGINGPTRLSFLSPGHHCY